MEPCPSSSETFTSFSTAIILHRNGILPSLCYDPWSRVSSPCSFHSNWREEARGIVAENNMSALIPEFVSEWKPSPLETCLWRFKCVWAGRISHDYLKSSQAPWLGNQRDSIITTNLDGNILRHYMSWVNDFWGPCQVCLFGHAKFPCLGTIPEDERVHAPHMTLTRNLIYSDNDNWLPVSVKTKWH